MHIERLEISHVRNLESVRLVELAKVNVFFGDNGSGKTSLLESIYVLGLGRSFRTRQFKSVINQNSDETIVFCSAYEKITGNTLDVGVRRSRSTAPKIRIGGEDVTSLSELAKLFPLQLINSDSFLLLEGPPSVRRQFLDWGVFHVEHSFHSAWLNAKRCLKHRNSVLRHGKINVDELRLWSKEFASAARLVDEFRIAYIIQFKPIFESIAAELMHMSGLDLEYSRGWSPEKRLIDVLNDCLDRDKYHGFTSQGPQRCELKITKDGRPASEYLSRGQEKLLIFVLKLAQAATFEEMTGKKCIFLIDDLPSEFDSKNRAVLCSYLENLGCQVFITCTNIGDFDDKWRLTERIKWFHVEHGQITQV